jgi:hypothetical protein
MPLTTEQRAELEGFGPETVRIKLMQCGTGRTALVPGLDFGALRGDVENWLGEKHSEEAANQRRTLRWGIVSALAGIASVIVGGVAIWLAR